MCKPKISIKKIIIIVLIVPILIHFYYHAFGIGYARKEYKFNRLDYLTWLNNLPKIGEENPYPLGINLKKIPDQYAHLDFDGHQKEPNWYNYHIVAGSDIFTEKEYKTLFLYDISVSWPRGSKVFTYNERYNLPEYRDIKINTSQKYTWNEDDPERGYFGVTIPGFYRDTLFRYRLDYIDIPPIPFNDIFNYKIKDKFPCTVVIKYALDDEEPLTESYDFMVEVRKGHWWNPNNPWMILVWWAYPRG
jgi:hypothetical protein